MHDRLRAKVEERLPDRRKVGQIAPQQAAAQDRPLVAGGKVVVDAELMPLLPQRFHHMAADISRAAHYQNLHVYSPSASVTASQRTVSTSIVCSSDSIFC